jgi:glyoxylase-like metal-dependent hydrolase (beta-lactamase superfamily II)
MIPAITAINLTIAKAYLVQGARAILIDSGAPGSAPRILRALEQRGVTKQDVSLILLTHAHSDHAGSAAELRATLGAPVAIHAADAAMLRRGDNGAFIPVGLEARMSRRFVDKPFPGLAADLLVDEQTDFSDYGIDGRLLHTPGHSPGSVSLLLPGGQAIVGDILRGGFMGGMVLSGRPSYPYFLYDLDDKDQLHDSIRRVLEAGAQRLHVGHGGPLPRVAVERWFNQKQG